MNISNIIFSFLCMLYKYKCIKWWCRGILMKRLDSFQFIFVLSVVTRYKNLNLILLACKILYYFSLRQTADILRALGSRDLNIQNNSLQYFCMIFKFDISFFIDLHLMTEIKTKIIYALIDQFNISYMQMVSMLFMLFGNNSIADSIIWCFFIHNYW